jgi:hypothetical protein
MVIIVHDYTTFRKINSQWGIGRDITVIYDENEILEKISKDYVLDMCTSFDHVMGENAYPVANLTFKRALPAVLKKHAIKGLIKIDMDIVKELSDILWFEHLFHCYSVPLAIKDGKQCFDNGFESAVFESPINGVTWEIKSDGMCDSKVAYCTRYCEIFEAVQLTFTNELYFYRDWVESTRWDGTSLMQKE